MATQLCSTHFAPSFLKIFRFLAFDVPTILFESCFKSYLCPAGHTAGPHQPQEAAAHGTEARHT